jgi:hypothetical protein
MKLAKRAILYTLLLTFSICKAQNFKFGIKTGLNMASFSVKVNDIKIKPLFGMHAGIVFQAKLTSGFYIQPEILFSQQGAKVESMRTVSLEGTNFDIQGTAIQKLQYLNMPLLAKFSLSKKLNLEAGPHVSYLLQSKTTIETLTTSTNPDYAPSKEVNMPDTKDAFNKYDIGATLGLDYQLLNGIFFQGRYNLGFIKPLKKETYDSRNGVLQISLGYQF